MFITHAHMVRNIHQTFSCIHQIYNKIVHSIIEILPSDDELSPGIEVTLYRPCNPSIVDKVAKSYSSNLCEGYNAYKGKRYYLSSEERKGRIMNLQEFIWSTIEPSNGEYQCDLEDSMDMKSKDISERNKVSIRKYL